jgi:hypothetical protein
MYTTATYAAIGFDICLFTSCRPILLIDVHVRPSTNRIYTEKYCKKIAIHILEI